MDSFFNFIREVFGSEFPPQDRRRAPSSSARVEGSLRGLPHELISVEEMGWVKSTWMNLPFQNLLDITVMNRSIEVIYSNLVFQHPTLRRGWANLRRMQEPPMVGRDMIQLIRPRTVVFPVAQRGLVSHRRKRSFLSLCQIEVP